MQGREGGVKLYEKEIPAGAPVDGATTARKPLTAPTTMRFHHGNSAGSRGVGSENLVSGTERVAQTCTSHEGGKGGGRPSGTYFARRISEGIIWLLGGTT